VAVVNLQSSIPGLPPPQSAQRFRSDDLDEVGEFVARFSGHHSRVVRGSGPLGFEQAWLPGASVVAGWVRIGLATTVRGAVRQPTLHIALSGGAEYCFGRRRLSAWPGTMTFVPPGWEYTVDRQPGAAFALAFGQARLVEEIEACDPDGRGTPLMRSRKFVPGRVMQSGLMPAIEAYLQAVERDGINDDYDPRRNEPIDDLAGRDADLVDPLRLGRVLQSLLDRGALERLSR
jgi:hypothetical protein